MANEGKNRNRRLCVMAVAAFLALLLVACGSGKEDSTKDTDTQGASKPEKKTEDTQAGQTPDSDNPKIAGETESTGTPINGLSVEIGEVLEGSFTGKEIQTDDQGDAGQVAVLDPEEAKQLEIVFTEQTTFTVRSSTDMGATHTDTPGSSSDLASGRQTEVSGTRDGDTIHASSEMIMDCGN